MHYGPSRDSTVRPGDMDTAMNLMDLMAALSAERNTEERRELEMKILGKPTGGGSMTLGAGIGKPTRFGRAAGSVRPRSGGIDGGEETVSRREAAAVNKGPLISDAEYDVQKELAGQKANYYGARAGAAQRISSSADYEYAQQRLDEIETRLLSKSVTDMERDDLLEEQAMIKAALLAAVLGENGRRPGPGGGGSGGSGAGGGVVRPSNDVTDWTQRR
jgi:hypothetical protein